MSKPSTTQAELVLLPNQRNCLVNLPSTLVSVLLNANTLAQNVVVELSYRQPSKDPKQKSVSKSVALGWTGMQAQARLAPVVGREGIRREEKDVLGVEVDATFARVLGLSEGMKVGIALHLDPPQAHTVHIEPVTATDWEIIELHARFLEMNFLSQIRALPNPAAGHAHPLTLHLTPTATANILVTSLTPASASTQTFVKISPDAEVIVAPKTRQATRPTSSRDNRSVASTSRRSRSGRSKNGHDEEKARPPLFLRGVIRALKSEWFEDGGAEMLDEGLKIWLDRDHLLGKTLKGATWAAVTVIKPAGLQEQVDPQSAPSPDQLPAQKVVAKLCPWDDAPDSRHVALSTLLCATLDSEGLVGGLVRIDAAPPPLPKTASALKDSSSASKEGIVKRLRVTPFAQTGRTPGFKFGAESKAEKEDAVSIFKSMFGKSLLEGALTDGMMLPKSPDMNSSWPGGILDFDPPPPPSADKKTNWLLGSERKLEIVMQPATPPPKLPQPPGEPLPTNPPAMVGAETLLKQTRTSLLHGSSVLLTGGLGSGKTSLAQLLACQLREEKLWHTIYFPCRTLISDETRVKTIKDSLYRLFATASWGARLAGLRALVVLDDLDRLVPVETELQTEGNGRSRQVSELLCNIVRQFCGRAGAGAGGVVMLATAQSKEGVHSVVVGGHVVRDIFALKAPSKDGRRRVIEMLVRQAAKKKVMEGEKEVGVVENGGMANEWMEGSRPVSADSKYGVEEEEEEDDDGSGIDPDLDLLEIAGQTDGYMPGDLALLVSRARSEALIRTITSSTSSSPPNDETIILTEHDFTSALKGFTPASLRNVTLHSSTTTFANIGGLHATRRTLLETLQYPTTYAPLFASCPLRLRSGLLLYGYPGCGKTLLASAVAGECGLNFISVKGPEILNKYIGASEKSVRDLFERAEAARPSVLFFDEFDSIAPRRGHDSTGVTDRVVNMLLTLMDGAEGLQGVYVLAATSRPDLIDPALLRPGRLDRSLICDLPSLEDRVDILRAVSGGLKLEEGVDLGPVAERTEGYSGADLQAVLFNAHLEAIHDVLGSDNSAEQDFGKRKNDNGTAAEKDGRYQDFSYFRMGGDENLEHKTPATIAAERAQIATRLSALQQARRKAKADRHAAQGRLDSSNGDQTGVDDEPKHVEPVISWRHLQKSLESTRASISVQERRRLERIYREFVQGRNGEMLDGSQGGSEVGGRSSLM